MVYQCHIFPILYDTYYGCDTLNNQTTTECDTDSISSPVPYGLQIDNEDGHDLVIDAVIIRQVDGTTIHIDYFCFNHSRTEPGTFNNLPAIGHCLDARYNGYDIIQIDVNDLENNLGGTYQSQLILIDPLLTNNESYVEIVDYDDPNFSYQCQPGVV